MPPLVVGHIHCLSGFGLEEKKTTPPSTTDLGICGLDEELLQLLWLGKPSIVVVP